MKKIFNKIICTLVLISVISLAACKKDFLEIAPKGVLSQTVLATKVGINGLLIGAYSILDEKGTMSGDYYARGPSNWIEGGIASDDAKAGTFGELPDIELFENYKVTPTNPILGYKWVECYGGVQRANDVLRLLALLPANTLTADEALQIKAEAIFLRAIFHLELVKIFLNVPYIDESVSFGAGNYNVPNTTLIWSKII